MHLLDSSRREYCRSFRTVSSNVLTNRQETKHLLWLSECSIMHAQRGHFKRKDCMTPSKKHLKDVLPKGEEWGLNSLTHQHHSQDFFPMLDSLADYSVLTNSPSALYPVVLFKHLYGNFIIQGRKLPKNKGLYQ